MDTGLTYLAIAYAGFFVVLAGYLARIVRRDAELEAAVDSLQARLDAADRSQH